MSRLSSFAIRSLLAAIIAVASLNAFAANPVNGQVLYTTAPSGGQACATCHPANPFADNTATITRGRNSPATINNAFANITQMKPLAKNYTSANVEDIAAYLGNAPTTLNFGTVNVGSTSASLSISVYASTAVPLTLTSITISAGDFSIASGTTCPTGAATLAAGTSCTVNIAFKPSITGARAGTLNIAHGNTSTPIVVALTGNGFSSISPAISISPANLVFGDTVLGATSATQNITVTNTGNASLSMSGFALSGANSVDFTIAASSTCSTSVALAASATCTLAIAFTPSSTGSRSAALTINSNASNGAVTATLAGNGVTAPAPVVSLSATSINYGLVTIGTTTSTNVILTNAGNATLNITAITVTTNPPFSQTNACVAGVAAGASCTLTLSYTPTAAVTDSGSISIVSNAASSPNAIALAGSGTTQTLPVLAWNGAIGSLAFGDVTVGSTSATQTLTLANQGPGATTLQSLAISGTQAGDFAIDASSTCKAGNSLPAAATCTVVLTFRPTATGLRSASLAIASSGTNPPSVALSGNGLAGPPILTLSAASLAFLGSTPPPQTLTLTNTGGSTLSITGVRIGSGPFAVAPATVNGCPTGSFNLLPTLSCDVIVSMNASASGSGSGGLQITSTASGSPTSIALSYSNPQMTNIGGSGCSIATATGDGPIDPTLWLLAALAGVALHWRARRRRHSARHH